MADEWAPVGSRVRVWRRDAKGMRPAVIVGSRGVQVELLFDDGLRCWTKLGSESAWALEWAPKPEGGTEASPSAGKDRAPAHGDGAAPAGSLDDAMDVDGAGAAPLSPVRAAAGGAPHSVQVTPSRAPGAGADVAEWMLSPNKHRYGINYVPAHAHHTVEDEEHAARAALGEEPGDTELTRVGPEYQVFVPPWTGAPATELEDEVPPTRGAHADPELIWAPHFEGKIRDLIRSPPRAEVERYEELRRRHGKPCGLPGCTLHDKHAGPHIFPEITEKRQGKAPWRGMPRALTTTAVSNPAARRSRAGDSTSDSSETDSSDGDEEGGKRLNADRAAAREARRVAQGTVGRKRERAAMNYRAFGGIMPRGSALDDSTTATAIAAAKAAKGDLSDRDNVGLARRTSAEVATLSSRYERVPVVDTTTGKVVSGRRAPMRINLGAFLERFPDFAEHIVPKPPKPSKRGRVLGAAHKRHEREDGRFHSASGHHRRLGADSDSEGGESEAETESGEEDESDEDESEEGEGEGEGEDEAEGADADGPAEDMTQERVNELFAVGSRVCAYPGCCKIYASTDGVRKHAKRCHMAWVLERDAAKEGVWLEPVSTTGAAAEPGASTAAAHAAKKHGPRGAALAPTVRKGPLASSVPWSLPDKRRVYDRDRLQLWPTPSAAAAFPSGLLDASGWLVARPAAVAERARARAPHAPDAPTGARALASVALQPSPCLAQPELAEPLPPSASLPPEARESVVALVSEVRPTGSSRVSRAGLLRLPPFRALPGGLTRGVPPPMPERPLMHIASAAARLPLSELLAHPTFRHIYFSAAGSPTPVALELDETRPVLDASPPKYLPMVYWRVPARMRAIELRRAAASGRAPNFGIYGHGRGGGGAASQPS